jgi:hypothetical protein
MEKLDMANTPRTSSHVARKTATINVESLQVLELTKEFTRLTEATAQDTTRTTLAENAEIAFRLIVTPRLRNAHSTKPSMPAKTQHRSGHVPKSPQIARGKPAAIIANQTLVNRGINA